MALRAVNAITINAPTNLTVKFYTSQKITISWSDNSNNETGFKIEQAIERGNFSVIYTTGQNTTSYTKTGLTPNTTYSYRVRAYSGTTYSTYSNYSNVAAGLTPSTGPNYYLNTNNTENGNGTITSPWNTVASINRLYFCPGNVIYIARGTTVTGTPIKRKATKSYNNQGEGADSVKGLLSPLGNGNKTSQIIIDAYGTGSAPIIDANGDICTAAILLYNQQFWTIQNIEVRNKGNTTTENFRWGIYIYNDDGSADSSINILNNTVRNVLGYNDYGHYNFITGGIYLKAEVFKGTIWTHTQLTQPGIPGNLPGGHFDGVLIQGNQVYDIVGEGIFVWGQYEDLMDYTTTTISGKQYHIPKMNWNNFSTNVIVRGNTVRRTSNSGIMVGGTENGLIEYNLVDSAGQIGGSTNNCLIGLWVTRDRNPIIQFNEISHTRMQSWDCQAMEHDMLLSGHAIFQYNYTHDNDGSPFAEYGQYYYNDQFIDIHKDETSSSHSIYRYNISQNDGKYNIEDKPGYLWNTRGGVEIYNNVFYTTYPVTIHTNPNGSFKNNIFLLGNGSKINNDAYGDGGPGTNTLPVSIFTNNCFYSSNSGSIALPQQNNTGYVLADPKLVDPVSSGSSGFKLKISSPCARAGITMAKNGGRDYWQTPLYLANTWIGAYQPPPLIPLQRILLH